MTTLSGGLRLGVSAIALLTCLSAPVSAEPAQAPSVITGTEEADYLSGTERSDFIYGLGGDDRLWGGEGDDRLDGGPDDDSLEGDEGVDVLVGGPGADRLYGGTDQPVRTQGPPEADVASYLDSPAAVVVDLGARRGMGADATGDTYYGIEAVTGSAYDDFMYGDDAANFLAGGTGNDRISGGDGDDVLMPGTGADDVTGGTGIDTLSFRDLFLPVEIHVGRPALNRGPATEDVVRDVERYEGGRGEDLLVGSASDDWLAGNDGSDRLEGGDGADQLFGGGGGDIVVGGAGDDLVDGGGGWNELRGGPGADRFVAARDRLDVIEDFNRSEGDRIVLPAEAFTDRDGKPLLEPGHPPLLIEGAKAVPYLPLPTFKYARYNGLCDKCLFLDPDGTGPLEPYTVVGLAGSPRLDAEDIVILPPPPANLILGGPHDDSIFDTAADDVVDPGPGDDSFTSVFGGSDRVLGSPGRDYASGHPDSAVTMDYSNSPEGILIMLGRQDRGGRGGYAEGDALSSSVRHVIGSAFDDTMIGLTYTPATIAGGAGADTIKGGTMADRILPGTGADIVDAGAGQDVVSYEDVPGGVVVDLGNPAHNAGEAALDKLVGFESAAGTDGGDHLIGTSLGNRLEGRWGNDLLEGRGGRDVLVGGAGFDDLRGGPGPDKFVYESPVDGGLMGAYGDHLDFDPAEGDMIVLSAAGFGKGFRRGWRPAFVAASDPKPATAKPTILYRVLDKQIWIDRDGTGPEVAFLLASVDHDPIASSFLVDR
ncbi:calcium-binding protein [Oharaeibacter diazotrophicus]|uniref:Hemolysin type calcium-binding protein n=1 Tax=Oharaeibacter diazotrophicus TaxID=1920512 RepID=A0A4V3CWK3_9HYPH|nr:calcium-binding protein [Oharaeibacter diazotrophicus]TDP86708.1 hemolysin type calcium-binding protein [Oharaeibacter diazotrophicus]BBE71350.1 bifunctional hemolysin/adenylate cyclase precursor [Pleomorphomonas sp. SM30]GLS78105.1 hypothetical protein GCM10007904_34420 [Oharaeibacter diazotrophicus]